MRKILINYPGHEQGRLFNPNARDRCLEPYIHLRDRLRELGYELTTADDHSVKGASSVWFWNVVGVYPSCHWWHDIRHDLRRAFYPSKATRRLRLYRECKRAGLSDNMVLFLSEPPSVMPRNWDQRVHKMFPTVFTWHDDYVDHRRYHKYHYPLPGTFPEVPDVTFDDRKLLVAIYGYKESTHPRELYSARKRTIGYFSQSYPGEFSLYGKGWMIDWTDDSISSVYRGPVEHKWDVYPYYRFGLCYENIYGEPGYVTEKIFDCMRAGCVPVYWGAPNIDSYVDQDAFIDRRRFSSDADLAGYLSSMSELEYRRHRLAAEDYLQSEKFTEFLPQAFADNIIHTLSL